MKQEVLKQGDDFALYGVRLKDFDHISSLIIYANGILTVCYPVYDMRRQWKRFFRRPSLAEAQEVWLNKCLDNARNIHVPTNG